MTNPVSGWQDPNPRDAPNPGNNTALVVAGAVLTLVVAVALVSVVLLARNNTGVDAHGTVVLTPANAPGPDPFTPSVVVTPTQLTGSTPARLSAVAAQLPVSTQRGVRIASGTQPGLYGGAPQDNSCDAAALANYLDADAALAAAWAAPLGLSGQASPFYLNSLTPVILLNDTWVTSHSLDDGQATPFQTVLQAGSAVMLDRVGIPRVHCASGAPLLPPADDNLTDYTIDGDAWSGYDPRNVVAVAYTAPGAPPAPATDFGLLDISSAEPFTRPAGGTINIETQPGVTLPDPAAMNVAPSSAGS